MKNTLAILLFALSSAAGAQALPTPTPTPSTPAGSESTFVVSAQTPDSAPGLAGGALALFALGVALAGAVALSRSRR